MLKNNSKIALIPAYNPDQKITGVVKGLKDSGFTVIIVNDGSDPEFDYLFDKSNGADEVIAHEENRGKGIALKTGLRWIYKNCTPPYTVVTVDADGQHLTSDALRVSSAAKRCPSTLIIGSRRLKHDAPFRSKSGNLITRVFLNTLTPVRIYDTQSGLRGFTHDLIPVLTKIEGSRYEYEMQMLMFTSATTAPRTSARSTTRGGCIRSSSKTRAEERKSGGKRAFTSVVFWVQPRLYTPQKPA